MKKRMILNRLLGMLTISTLILGSASNVLAGNSETNTSTDTNEYAISSIDLKVMVPSDLNVLTRNVSSGNAALELLDADAVSLQNSYIQNHIYLNAFPDELNYEIVVSATAINTGNAVNFNELPIENFDEYTEHVKQEFEKSQTDELLDLKIYENSNGRYVLTLSHSNLNETSTYVARYYTVMNGHNYYYTLQTDGTEITEDILDKLTTIVDSAQYVEVKHSIKESALFMELWETFIGFGLTVLFLGVIIFLMIRSTKVRH